MRLHHECHTEIDHYGCNAFACDDDELCCLGTMSGKEMIDHRDQSAHDDHAKAALQDGAPYTVRPDIILPVIDKDENDHLKDTRN